jgi:hypothetical protein
MRVLLYLLELAAKPVSKLKLAALTIVKVRVNTDEIRNVRKGMNLKL